MVDGRIDQLSVTSDQLTVNSEIKKIAKKHGLEIREVIPLEKANVNKVFKITDVNGRAYIFRVLRDKNWPKIEKFEYVSKSLDDLGITQAKLLGSGITNEFKEGYVIQSFIEGVDADEVLGKSLSFEVYYQKLGLLLKQIHSKELPYFGSLTHKDRQFGNYDEWLKGVMDWVEKDLGGHKTTPLLLKARKWVQENLGTEFDKPVMCHADISAKNVRWTGKEAILIDWDNARADLPEADMGVMFWWGHFGEKEAAENNQRIFLEAYGKNYDEFRQKIKVQQMIEGMRLLPWYAKYDKNENAMRSTIEYLEELIKSYE